MRVNQSNVNPAQTSDVSKTSQTKKTTDTSKGKKSGEVVVNSDGVKTEISAKGKDAAKAKQIAMSAPDVREEKIAELKRRIAEGKYQVDAQGVADKLVDEHIQIAGV